MYTYTMERTQIYLSRREIEALDTVARQTGKTRSHLIREAIEEKYLPAGPTPDEWERALREAAGAWKDRDFDGKEYVERIRQPGLGYRIERLYGEPTPDEADADPPR